MTVLSLAVHCLTAVRRLPMTPAVHQLQLPILSRHRALPGSASAEPLRYSHSAPLATKSDTVINNQFLTPTDNASSLMPTTNKRTSGRQPAEQTDGATRTLPPTATVEQPPSPSTAAVAAAAQAAPQRARRRSRRSVRRSRRRQGGGDGRAPGPQHHRSEGHEHPAAHPDRQGPERRRRHRHAQAGADLPDPQGADRAERLHLLGRRARGAARRLRLPARARLQLPARPRRHLRLAVADPQVRPADRRHRVGPDPAAEGRGALLRARSRSRRSTSRRPTRRATSCSSRT